MTFGIDVYRLYEARPLDLEKVKVDIRPLLKSNGFIPTTDEQRRAQQKDHKPQCRCKFCAEAS